MKHKMSTAMQKTWSILTESDSPNSASSTDANYSSTSAGNSSDDSNCSNQTNYSMSTGVMASPPASSGGSSSSSSSPASISSTSSGDSPPPPLQQQQHQTPQSKLQQQQLQQLQQQLQLQQQQQQQLQLQHQQTSQQQPTLTPIQPQQQQQPQAITKETKENPPFNYVTTPQLAETTLQRIKQRYCTPPDNNGNNTESAMRSLELLRMTIQCSFDKEVDVIIRRYIETYFKPAFSNIKENLGDTAVSEEVLQKMSCALLENSKAQYNGMRKSMAQASFFTSDPITMPQEPNEQIPIRAGVKRPIAAAVSVGTAANNNNTATISTVNSPPQKRAFSSVAIKAPVNTTSSTVTVVATTSTPNLAQQTSNTSTERRDVSSAPLPPSNFQPFRGTAIPVSNSQSVTTLATARRQIVWNTANVALTTKFVLDVQANQAFGFGTDGRERLASKHPELIRYLPDTEDRNWLISQHIITQHNRNSRFLFLVYDEVCNLIQTHEVYRNKANMNLAVMRTFTVPEFMIEKMRNFFIDLNIKSRGLITTSTSNANLQQQSSGVSGKTSSSGNSTTSSAAVVAATSENQTNTTTITTSFTGSNGNIINSSQLRTALLQGQSTQQQQQQPTQLSLFNEDTLMSNGSNDYVTTTTSTLNDSNPNVSNFSAAFQQPARTSALSSTHATLTALLNNSTSPGVPPPLSRVYTAQSGQICAPRNAVTATLQQVTSSNIATVKTNATAYVTSSGSNRNNNAVVAATTSNNHGRSSFTGPTATRTQSTVPPNKTLVRNITGGNGGKGKPNAATTAAVQLLTTNRNMNVSITSIRPNAATASNQSSNNNNSNNIGRPTTTLSIVRNSNNNGASSNNSQAPITRINAPQGSAANLHGLNRNITVGSSTSINTNRNPIRNPRATSSRN